MKLRPIAIDDACRYVARLHRHLDPPQGAKFAIAAVKDRRVVAVALVGNPVARLANDKRSIADDGWIAEVIRVASNGTRNACSFLYSRAKRAAQALGFERVITKTLPTESGASLRAVGAKQVGITRAQQWDRANRRRKRAPLEPKLRWEL